VHSRMVFCFVQLFLPVQSTQEITSYHEAIIPAVPRSHRGPQCVGPRLLAYPALPRARRLASLPMRSPMTGRSRSSGSNEPPYHLVRRWCSGWRGLVIASRNSSNRSHSKKKLLESMIVYIVLIISLIMFVIAGWRLPQAFITGLQISE
jgi:hypothetical protein